MESNKHGFTLIELLVVLAIISIFILGAVFAYRAQLNKGRDARRKADLYKLQNILEDYLNDYNCYSSDLTCGADFLPYLSEIPCDPINNLYYNYFYSNDSTQTCKRWYKIYAKLENENDPVIAELGCEGGCGPSANYNYWVSSPNVPEVDQLPGEIWPVISGVPTAIPTPEPTPIPTPILCPSGYYGCLNGICEALGPDPVCSPNFCTSNCADSCYDPDPDTGGPINECTIN